MFGLKSSVGILKIHHTRTRAHLCTHPHTPTQTSVHLCTPAYNWVQPGTTTTCAHLHTHRNTPMHTRIHLNTPTHISAHALKLMNHMKLYINRPNTIKATEKGKGRNKSPLKHFNGLKSSWGNIVNGKFMTKYTTILHFLGF